MPSLWAALITLYQMSAIYLSMHNITQQRGYLHCKVCCRSIVVYVVDAEKVTLFVTFLGCRMELGAVNAVLLHPLV